tara:strand:+ start:48 stop:257 length:210 start_codon:yes stop_codon:yes gene_type:complete
MSILEELYYFRADAKNDGVRNNGKYLGSFYNAFDWAVRGRYELYVFGILTVYQEASYGLLRFGEKLGAI